MPSRKGQDKARQSERPGDFVLEGIPLITQHARQRMTERHVSYHDVLRNKVSAGVIADEATGRVITVVPDSFVQDQRRRYQTRRRAGVGKVAAHLHGQQQPQRSRKGRSGLSFFDTICAEARSDFSKGANKKYNGASQKKQHGQTQRNTEAKRNGASKQKVRSKTKKELQVMLVLDKVYLPTDWTNQKMGKSTRKLVNDGLKSTLKPFGIASTYLPSAPGFNIVGLDPDKISLVEQLFCQGQVHASELIARPPNQEQNKQTVGDNVALTYICIVVDYVRTLLAFWDYRLAPITPALEPRTEQACLVLPDSLLPKMLLWVAVPGVLKQTIEACGVEVKKVLPQDNSTLLASTTKEFRCPRSPIFSALSSSAQPIGAKFLIEVHGIGDEPTRILARVSDSFEKACRITLATATLQDHHGSKTKDKEVRGEVAKTFVTNFEQVRLDSQR